MTLAMYARARDLIGDPRVRTSSGFHQATAGPQEARVRGELQAGDRGHPLALRVGRTHVGVLLQPGHRERQVVSTVRFRWEFLEGCGLFDRPSGSGVVVGRLDSVHGAVRGRGYTCRGFVGSRGGDGVGFVMMPSLALVRVLRCRAFNPDPPPLH